MSIKETLEKIKPFYTLLLIIVIAFIFFGLGRLSLLEERHKPIKIEYPNKAETGAVINAVSEGNSGAEVSPTPTDSSGAVIGSKSGKKYYFPWCGTVKRIKPENQVHFASIEEAKKAGFTPGGNCKGLK
ncbi:MAG TPA: hypothetical protein VGC58_01850 [Candidatus Paceibacterota bacterium]